MTTYNIDLTLETTEKLEKSDLEDRIRAAAETDEKIKKVALAQRIEKVNEK